MTSEGDQRSDCELMGTWMRSTWKGGIEKDCLCNVWREGTNICLVSRIEKWCPSTIVESTGVMGQPYWPLLHRRKLTFSWSPYYAANTPALPPMAKVPPKNPRHPVLHGLIARKWIVSSPPPMPSEQLNRISQLLMRSVWFDLIWYMLRDKILNFFWRKYLNGRL